MTQQHPNTTATTSTASPAGRAGQDGTGGPDVATLGYEEARAELVDTVRRLEAGAASLEESLALWERGEALADRCEEVLAGASARIEAVTAPTSARVDAHASQPEGAQDSSAADDHVEESDNTETTVEDGE